MLARCEAADRIRMEAAIRRAGDETGIRTCIREIGSGPKIGSIRFRIENPGVRFKTACWHRHRDFMKILFGLFPALRLTTALADYRGREDFLAKYDKTGYRSPNPMRVGTNLRMACNCPEI